MHVVFLFISDRRRPLIYPLKSEVQWPSHWWEMVTQLRWWRARNKILLTFFLFLCVKGLVPCWTSQLACKHSLDASKQQSAAERDGSNTTLQHTPVTTLSWHSRLLQRGENGGSKESGDRERKRERGGEEKQQLYFLLCWTEKEIMIYLWGTDDMFFPDDISQLFIIEGQCSER